MSNKMIKRVGVFSLVFLLTACPTPAPITDSSGGGQETVVNPWTYALSASPSTSPATQVAFSSSGDIFVTGSVFDTGVYNFGNGVTLTGTNSLGTAFLLKLNAQGQAQWVQAGNGNIWNDFQGLAFDTAGNIYAAGRIWNGVPVSFGSHTVEVTGTGYYSSALLVKYNSSGVAQWAKTVSTGTESSGFYKVAVDSVNGAVYAAGFQTGTTSYDYGNSVTATGPDTASNAVLVKYNTDGTPLAAHAFTAGGSSTWNDVVLDSSGLPYAAGSVFSATPVNLGNGLTFTPPASTNNALLVKFNTVLVPQTVFRVLNATESSEFRALHVAADGTVFAAGSVSGTASIDFGNSQSVTPAAAGNANALAVRWNSSAVAQGILTTTLGSSRSEFQDIVPGGSGFVLLGTIRGTGNYRFTGSTTDVAGSYASSDNAFYLRVGSDFGRLGQKTVQTGNNTSQFISGSFNSSGKFVAAGNIAGNTVFTFGSGLTVTGVQAGGLFNPFLVFYGDP